MATELSAATLAEMAEGAAQVRRNSGVDGALPPGYLDVIMKTQQRMMTLKQWERQNRVEIEYATRFRTGDKEEPFRATLVHVNMPDGTKATFQDLHAQETGGWPSEYLIAQIALALMANEGKPYEAAT